MLSVVQWLLELRILRAKQGRKMSHILFVKVLPLAQQRFSPCKKKKKEVLVSHSDVLLMLWATLVIKDPVTACSEVLLAKTCVHVRLQSQGIARKPNSPLRSGINPHLTQAVVTNACRGRGAPRGKTLTFLVLQEHTFALSLLNSASLGRSPSGAGCWGASGG